MNSNSRVIDFAVITIKEEEFDAALDQFGAYEGRGPETIHANRDYAVIRVPVRENASGATEALVAITRCATQGNGVSQDITRDIILDLSPSWILLVGIAGALPASEFSLGDVVLNSTVLDFSVEAVKRSATGAETERTFAVQSHAPHYKVENFATTVAAHERALGDWFDLTIRHEKGRRVLEVPKMALSDDLFYGDSKWRDEARDSIKYHSARIPRKPKVLGVALGSSDRLIKDPEIVQIWLRVARQIRAIEMESAGVHIAARGRSKSRPGLPAMSIRGISDVVGYKRNESWTRYACHSAAAFANAFVRSGYVAGQAEGPSAKAKRVRGVRSSSSPGGGVDPKNPAAAWGPAEEVVNAISLTLSRQGPQLVGTFTRACMATRLAIKHAMHGNETMTRARRLLADVLPNDYGPKGRVIVRASEVLSAREEDANLGAVLWDSGDEYFGEVASRGPTGLGVYKIYKISKTITPNLVAHYRGELIRDQYTHGVWESARSWIFAGEWVDGRPRLGCITQSAEAEGAEYDLYIGELGEPQPLQWVPEGIGVSLNYKTTQLKFGTFRKGIPAGITEAKLDL